MQVKWRAELRERELERMSGLEGEWRRREATRTAEIAKIKAHYTNLDAQTRQVQLNLIFIHSFINQACLESPEGPARYAQRLK